MDVAVQWVRTSWTKAARGAPMATRRMTLNLAYGAVIETVFLGGPSRVVDERASLR